MAQIESRSAKAWFCSRHDLGSGNSLGSFFEGAVERSETEGVTSLSLPQRKSVVLLAEEYLRKGLPKKSRSEFFGKRSSEHRSIAARNTAACKICSAATKRRGTLLAEMIKKQKRGFACRRIFKKRAPEKVAQRVFREEEQRASEQSREEHSGLQNLLRCDEAEGNPPRGKHQEAKAWFCLRHDLGSGNSLASLPEGGGTAQP